MLIIGFLSIYGTIYPARTPFDFNIYKSPYYLTLLFLFFINIVYCSYFRIVKVFSAVFEGNFKSPLSYIVVEEKEILKKFSDVGYKIISLDDGFMARKGTLRSVMVILAHVSVALLMVAAGISSYLGFLGTVNIHEGKSSNICFSWKEKKDVNLPFELFVNNVHIDFYPMPLKIEIENLADGSRKQEITKEGDLLNFENRKIKIVKAIPEKKTIVFNIKNGDKEEGPFENIYISKDMSFKIIFLAYRDPLPRQYYAYISAFDKEGKKESKAVSINNPMYFNGYRIYLIDIGVDDFGFAYAGFQITKEPLINFIWFLCIVIIVCLSLYHLVEERFLRFYREEDKLIVHAYKNIFTEKELKILDIKDNEIYKN